MSQARRICLLFPGAWRCVLLLPCPHCYDTGTHPPSRHCTSISVTRSTIRVRPILLISVLARKINHDSREIFGGRAGLLRIAGSTLRRRLGLAASGSLLL